MKYITIFQLLEKANREKPSNAKLNIGDVKEWISEAMNKISSKSLFTEDSVLLHVKDGRVTLPFHVAYIKEVLSKDGRLVKRDSMDHEIHNFNEYLINGRVISVGLPDDTPIEVRALTIPTDSSNNPLILNNEYLISALVNYILMRITGKMWLSDKIAETKFRHFEREWLFYVGSASNSLDMPREDEMLGWTFIHNPLSSFQDEIVMSGQTGRSINDRYNPRYITSDVADNK